MAIYLLKVFSFKYYYQKDKKIPKILLHISSILCNFA